MQINVAVTDANNIVCEVVPPQTQVITIDRGVAGNGIVSIVPVTISTFQYLRITYTNGTVQDVGPLTSTAYTATAPITIVGNTISLATVPIASGGTDATTAAGAIQNLLPSYTGNANKRLGLNSGGTALEWVADGGGTVTSVAMTVPTGLSISGSPITSSGTLALTMASGYAIPTTASQTNWDTAYTERQQWSGTATNLVASTGRTSLGATTLGSNLFTITNPSAITFPRFNADNTVSALDAATFRAAIGAGTSSTTGTVTSVSGTGTVNGLTLTGTVTTSGSLTLGGTLDLSGYNGVGAFSSLSVSGTTTLGGNISLQNNSASSQTPKYIQSNAFGGAIRFSANSVTASDRNVQLGTVNNAGTFAGYLEVGDNYVTVQGLNLGKGASAVATNTVLGSSALNNNTTGTSNTAVGYQSLYSNTTGYANNAFGLSAGFSITSGAGNALFGNNSGKQITTANDNSAFGVATLFNSTGTANSAFGNDSLYSNTSGNYNTALGASSLRSNTTASQNTAIGYQASYNNTTGTRNFAGGVAALYSNTTGSYNVAVGHEALGANTTAIANTGVGYQAGYSNTTGGSTTAFGYQALRTNTTGDQNVAVGESALYATTTGSYNTAMGTGALKFSTTASNNTAVGYFALVNNITGSNNTALGYTAGYSNTLSSYNVFIGRRAGYTYTGSGGNDQSVFVGNGAGEFATTGSSLTLVGPGAGYQITSGSKHTILGGYSGNQNGLDIRTANNFVVLADGDGNPRAYNNGYNWFSTSGGFISKLGSAYSSSYTTDSSWSTNWNTVIPGGTLGRGFIYLVYLSWTFTSGGSPYYLDATMLFTPQSTNGTSPSNEVALLSSTHTGNSNVYYMARSIATTYSTGASSGLQIQMVGNGTPGILYVNVTTIGV